MREFHRGKGTDKRNVVEKGDVVIVHKDNVKRGNWKMAEVTEVISGRDGEVRGAHVRMIRKGKVVHLNRPVQKLYPTEIKREERLKENVRETSGNKNKTKMVRPKRAAALKWQYTIKFSVTVFFFAKIVLIVLI